MSKSVLVAGYGSAGQYVVDFLLKDHRIKNIDTIYIMSRKSLQDVEPRLEISKISAGISCRYISLKYVCCDFNDIDEMALVLSEIKPDVVVYTGRYASGLKYGAYSYPNEIGYGVWLPMSFPYIYKLMQAVKKSGIETKVINTSFPDGVNPLLDTVGLAPYCGAGNLNHLIPRIENVFIRRGYDPQYLDVNLVGSHYLNTYVSKEGTVKGCPFDLSVMYLTPELIWEELVKDKEDALKVFAECKDNSAGGHIRNQMIATDCAEIVRLLTENTHNQTIHVPGFQGLPGGCRVVVRGSEKFVVDSNVPVEKIKEINTEGLRLDGVVIEDGAVRFTDEVRSKMKSVFGIKYPGLLYVEDMQKFADKIRERLLSL